MSEANSDAKKFNCTVTITDSGVWKKKISVVVPRSEVDAELERQFSEIRTNIQFPGFRKGRTPRRLVEKIYSKDVTNQAKFSLLTRAFEQVEDGEDFDILGEPDLTPDDIVLPETGDFTFEYEVEVKPEFELPVLDGITVEKEVVEVTEESIDTTIKNLCRRFGSMEEVEVAESEDHVMTDTVVTIEGVEEPLDLKEWPMWVSACTVKGIKVEDMASVLAGVKVGDVKKHSVIIAEGVKTAEWVGKKADMVITVKQIKRLKPAELTEEFIKSLDVEDEAELRKVVAEDMEARLDAVSTRRMAVQIYDYLEANTKFELPVGITARYADRLANRSVQELLNKGVSYAEIEQKAEEIKASAGEDAARQMRMSFILERVCEKLDITVTDAEINAVISQLSHKYGRRPEKMREELIAANRIAGIRDNIAEEKAVAKILETANVVDKEPSVADGDKAEDKKAAKKPVRKKVSETENQ